MGLRERKMSFRNDVRNLPYTRKFLRVAFVMFLLSTFNSQLATAQKFPERRTTRQGTRLYERGDYTGAEAAYRRAIELNPELREAAFNLGDALWRQERARDAAGAWAAVAADSLAPAPMVSAASYNIGNAALAGEQVDAAIEAYKVALRLQPDDQEAKYNLAYAQKMKQEQEQNQDQNEDQQDQGGGGGGGQNDQNQDQGEGDDPNDPQNGDQNQDPDKPQNGDGDNDGDGNPDNGNPPPPSGRSEAGIDPRTAEQMLDAMQAAEDDTRENMDARQVQAASHSGKNW